MTKSRNEYPFSILLLLGGAIFIYLSGAFAQTGAGIHSSNREVRAVWITTVNGLDWPKSTIPSDQQASLRNMIEELAHSNFNTIFFQVRGRGDAMFKSKFEPWSQLLTGTLGKDPGWDPLRFVCETAHRNGMEVHAWFNTFLIKSSKLETPETSPRHIVLEHPDWLRVVDGEYWLDPGLPAARKYLEEVALDIVTSYDVDGIQFDFMRYPSKPFPDDVTFRKFGGTASRDDWRRENINTFVRDVYARVHTAKRFVKVGSAPIGIYANFGSVRGLQSYAELYQDSRRWLRESIHDYLVPQVYWSLGEQRGDPDFSVVAGEWAQQRFQRHLYLGIGAYKPDVHNQLPELVDLARKLGVTGVAFFRYENVADMLAMGGRFEHPANIPVMPWLDSVPPPPPERLQLAYENSGSAGGSFSLKWQAPAGDSGDITRYDIYRSSRPSFDADHPATLVAVVPRHILSYTDTLRRPSAAKYYYAVSALDRGNNESAATPAQSAIVPEVLALASMHGQSTTLGEYFRARSGSVVYFPYTLRRTAPVLVKVIDAFNNEILNVVDAVQEAGNYVAAADVSSLRAGSYTYLLVAGEYSEKKAMKIDR